MAIKLFVDGNSTATVSDSNTTVVGASTGTQAIRIAAGVTGVTTDANVDSFTFSGNLSSYKFVAIPGTGTQVVDATGNIISTIPSLNTASVPVTFADGTANMVQTGASSFTLGGQAIASGTSATNAAAITSTAMGAGFGTTNSFTLSGATTVNEGASATYTVTRASAATVATTVNYTITGTATAGTDYTAQTGSLVFAVGESSKTITVPVTADLTTEATPETMIVTLTSVSPATDVITTAQSTVTTTISDTSQAVVGTTFTLTTATDIISGTSGNDTIVGDIATMGAADQITGGAGIDTLTFTGTTNVALPGSIISGVEVFNIRQTTLALASTDLSLYSGVTTVNLDRSNQAATFTNLASGGSFGVVGNESVSNTGALALGYAAAATSAIINFSNGTLGAQAVTLSGTGLTSTTINSTGAANVTGAIALPATNTALTIAATTGLTTGAVTNTGGAALTTVTITGAGAVNLSSTALESTVTTINASGNSGGVTVALGTAVTQTVTGSTGNDVITSGAVLTTGSVAAGSGTDTLVLGANVAHANTTTLAAKYTGFETLRLQGTWDAGLITSINAFELDAGASVITNATATQAAAVKARGDLTTTTFTLGTSTGSADALTMTMGLGTTVPAAANNAVNSGVMTLTGFETVNLVANPSATATAGTNKTSTITGAIVDTSLTTVNLTGTAFSFTNISSSKAVTWNGSALTGDGASTPVGLTVAGSAFVGSTITGSAVRDVFTIGAEGSAYNAGAGNDSITTTTAILVADGATDGTINGGDGTTDTLTISDTTTTLTDNHFTKLSNLEVLALTSTAAADHSVTLGGTFNAAFPSGATITTGTLAAGQDFTLAAGLASVPVNLTVDATLLVGTAAETHSLVTGSGADTVTFTGDATYTGVAGATGTIAILTGAGVDTISATYGSLLANTTNRTLAITAGTGADLITKVGTNGTGATASAQFIVASGDSNTTAGTYDSITGFDVADGTNISDFIDFAGVGAVGTLATSTDFGTIASHTITTGYAAFSTAAAYATATVINSTNLPDVIGYLAANTATLDAVAFAYDSNGDGSNDATMVYSNQATDSLVMLVGVTSGTLNITLTTTTAGTIAIA